MGLWSKFVSWLTGRDEKESEVYANYERVEQVRSEIRSIAYTKVGNAQDEFYDAIKKLNNVHGLADYVGTIQTTNYNTVFESITNTIDSIGDAMNEKAEAIKKYEESSWLEKVGSSVSMALCKVGEGLLSVVEDLGDGIVSVVGWTAGAFGAKDFQEDCANFIKKEWSHDAFNFYYNSDFAKASAFTEDSAIAGTFKLGGKIAGYLFAGGVMAGTGFASAAGAAVHASTTTIGATMVAGVTGLGSGTEAGLNEGKSFNDAFGKGVITGTLSAGTAFLGGKLSEGMAGRKYLRESGINKNATLKDGFQYIDDQATIGAASFKQGKSELKDLAKIKGKGYAKTYGKVHNQFEIKLGDNTSVQGYNDMFTNAGKRLKDANNLRNLAKIDAKLTQNANLAQSDKILKQTLDSYDEFGEEMGRDFAQSNTFGNTATKGIEAPVSSSANEFGNVATNTASAGSKSIGTIHGGSIGGTSASISMNYGSKIVANIPQVAQSINAAHNESIQASARKTANNLQMTAPIINAAAETAKTTTTTPILVRDTTRSTEQVRTSNVSTPVVTKAVTTANVVPKTVSTVSTAPIATVGAAVGKADTTSIGPTASISELMPKSDSTVQIRRDSVTPLPSYEQKLSTVTKGNGSVTPVPGSNGKTTSNVPITYHGGGEYNENGYVGDKNTSIAASIAGLTDDTDKIIGNIMNGDLRDNATKIPTGNKPINIGKKVGGGATIPLAAGLTTAAAAGLGAKAYSDYKRAQEEAEEEDYEDEYEEFDKDGIIVDGWTDDDVIEEMKNTNDDEKDFINIDKQDEDEYYRISENPLPISKDEDESFA